MQIIKGNTGKEWFLIIVFYALLLQNPISSLIPLFDYVDELFSILGIVLIIYQSLRNGRISVRRINLKILFALSMFVVTGLLGNLIYRYQPISAVLTDLLVNLKFFLSIVSGYMIFCFYEPQQIKNVIVRQARIVAILYFVLLLADLSFHIFSSPETRYGLRVVRLMYGHPTYLAGAVVYLLTALTIFYDRKSNVHILFLLVVLFFTLRGKAIAGAAIYILIFYFIIYYRKKLRIWHILIIALVALGIAWEQFSYYYIELEAESARSALTQTSFEILKDYFPIGTGFGTFASNSAAVRYSPVYVKYGLQNIWGLNPDNPMFSSDTFWPIIIGQTGAIGTICYLCVLLLIFLRVMKIRSVSIFAYATGIFAFAYLMISSTSEPAFNNSISIPLAMMLGYIFTLEKNAIMKG